MSISAKTELLRRLLVYPINQGLFHSMSFGCRANDMIVMLIVEIESLHMDVYSTLSSVTTCALPIVSQHTI